jgi:ATP-dependent exoDNAse (exonuclease V) beta subunit
MTVHKAKGLEFPVVILADMTAGMTGGVSRWVDAARGLCALRIAGWAPAELNEHEEDERKRDEAEGLRVAYVAATRARDLLVVPAIGDERYESGWVSCLNDVLYPAVGAWRRAQATDGCPPFGGETVLDRPAEIAFRTEGVQPGRHVFTGYDVTWWDPAVLSLGAQPRFGVRQKELLGKDASEALVASNMRRFTDWQEQRAAALADGARASHRVQTATARSAEPVMPTRAAEIVELPRVADRPRGTRFGALVHAILATAPLDGSAEAVSDASVVQGRVLGASGDEITAAARAVQSALGHPLLRRAGAAEQCRRETPITLRSADGSLVEGSVDLAFLDGGEWTVIDFKTDQELARNVDTYRRQVALYADAISAATGLPARAVLLRV